MKLQVLKSFKDKETKELYADGAEIELTDLDRINNVVAIGLCRITGLDSENPTTIEQGKFALYEREFDRDRIDLALKLAGVKGDVAKFKHDTVISKIAGLSDEEQKIFKEALLAD